MTDHGFTPTSEEIRTAILDGTYNAVRNALGDGQKLAEAMHAGARAAVAEHLEAAKKEGNDDNHSN